jgi:cysteine synthase A/cysteine synthase B
MDHAKRVYGSIVEMLPDEHNPTPLVRLRRVVPEGPFELHAKLEWANPLGSVKDRAAWWMLRDLEKKGELGDGRGLVEPTSGNTGFSLAALAGARGVPVRCVVPNGVPLEKKVLLKMAGAELDVVRDDLCPAPGLGDGSINLAKTHARANPDRYVLPNQYENEANAEAHYRTTGPEIWSQTEGRVTHFFTSLGTCGTVTGVARFLKERNPSVKIVAVQPSEGHDVPGIRNVSQLESCKLYDPSLIDEILEIDYRLAYVRALDLLRKEGLTAGPCSGLVLEGARRVVERDGGSGCGVLIFADHVFKYVANMIRHVPELERGTTPEPPPAEIGRPRRTP